MGRWTRHAREHALSPTGHATAHVRTTDVIMELEMDEDVEEAGGARAGNKIKQYLNVKIIKLTSVNILYFGKNNKTIIR